MKPSWAPVQRRQLPLLKLRKHIHRVWLASQKTVLSGSVEPVPHGQGRAVDVLHNCFFLTLHCYILDYFSHDFVVTDHTGTIRATIFRSSPFALHYGERKELSVLHFLPLIPFPVLLLKPDWSAVVSWWLEYIYIYIVHSIYIYIYIYIYIRAVNQLKYFSAINCN